MADSLDDFFARKDRAKKTKGKKAVSPADDGSASAGKAEETVKEKRKEKEKPAQQPLPDQNEEESEWKEVEYEKDYSGLRIHSMTIRDKEEEIREQKLQEATEQMESKKNDATGPWKSAAGAPADGKSVEEVPVPKKREEKKPEADGQAKYVPPGMRNQSAGQPQDPLVPSRLSKLVRSLKAPEIESQKEFPSLGAIVSQTEVIDHKPAPSVNSWKDSSVRSAARTEFRTENKFDALSEN